jgi:hypothetical protein
MRSGIEADGLSELAALFHKVEWLDLHGVALKASLVLVGVHLRFEHHVELGWRLGARWG